jgi:PilZ domain
MATPTAERQVPATAERRAAPRHPASGMASITGLRLSPGGGEVSLVNISSTGLLVRCTTKLLPGTPVTVTLDGTFSPSSIKGKVMRCFVADICRPAGLAYHIGIAFNQAIQLGDEEHEEPVEAIKADAAIQPSPVAPVLVNRW